MPKKVFLMIGISEARLNHSCAVARFMYNKAKEENWPEVKCKEMFLLGYVHDIGYEFSESQQQHPTIGGLLLKAHDYKYWKEVYFHGMPDTDYQSEELDLLNIADINVDSSGNIVGAKKRLNDIAQRYGVTSKQYLDCEKLASKLALIP